MEGSIANFRGGKHTKHNSQMIVQVKGIDKKDKASELVGKSVVWTSPAKKRVKRKDNGNSRK